MDMKYIKISTTALGEKSRRGLFLAAFFFTEYIIKVLKVPMVYRVVDLCTVHIQHFCISRM
jgi:hypothetical protein